MSLYTDSDFVTQAGLSYLDAEIAKVATAEAVTIDGPTGIGAQACADCGISLSAAIQTFGGGAVIGGVSWAHNAAVLNIGGGAVDMPRVMLSSVVIDGIHLSYPSPLRSWVDYQALYLFYRSVSSRKGKANDRYEEKRETYRSEVASAWRQVKQTGLPIVMSPLPCPGALHEVGAGVWGASNVTAVTGSGAAQTYFVAITYVDNAYYRSPTVKGNCESGPSAKISLTTLISQVIQIDINSLSPPDGTSPQIGTSQGITSRHIATGWNVYIGTSAASMYIQNATPIPIATKTYTLPGAPVLSGALMGTGQFPDSNISFQNMLMRA